MFVCYKCGIVFNELKKIELHLKYQEFVKEKSNEKIKCVKDLICGSTFETFSALKKHIQNKHATVEQVNTEGFANIPLEINVENESHNNTLDNNLPKFIQSPASLLEHSVSSFYEKLNVLGLPEDTISVIFSETKKITDCAIKIGCSSTPENLIENETHVSETFKSFSTKYQRQKSFTKNIFYAKPHQIPIGFRWEMRFDSKTEKYKRVLVQNCFQYVSITTTLRKIFQNNAFLNSFKKFNAEHVCEPNLYKYACCGSRFKSFEADFDNKNSVLLQLYYDDFEIARVLGSKTIIHKIGAIYFTILNCPAHLKSKLDNIFLVCLFYVNDLHGEFNLNSILRPIVSDIKILETEGIFIDTIGIMFGLIISLSHDNLAANDMIGLTKSFSAIYFCRFCIMERDVTKISTEEDPNLLRKDDCYLVLESIPQEERLKMVETKGVHHQSVLNELKYFNTMKNYSVDLMHDGPEGFVSLAIKYVLEFFIHEKILADIEKINDHVSAYNFGYIDRKNKTSNISLTKSNLGQNAIQILCLVFHFPFIFGRLYKVEHFPQWQAIFSALEILKVLLSYQITELDVLDLEKNIKIHLNCIKHVFHKNFTPKQHFLTHYPRVIREMGPVIHMWTMRYEGKHRYFTRNLSQNFVNVCKTLAVRHQQMISIIWSQSNFQSDIKKGKQTLFSAETDLTNHLLKPLYSLTYLESEYHYKKGFFILNQAVNEDLVHFYKILEILDDNVEINFLVSQFIGIYDNFYCSYQLIDKQEESICLNLKNVCYKRAYESQFCSQTNKNYIIGSKVQLV